MNKRAFFFQGDCLLLPAQTSESEIDTGVPLELAVNFENPEPPDVFEINSRNSVSVTTCVSVSANAALPDNWKSLPVRQLFAIFRAAEKNNADFENIIRACHVSQWKRESRFCGTCGAENNYNAEEGCRLCPACGRMEFPRICPAVIIIITDNENRILLAHNKKFRAGLYSHIAGFNEAGETLEETAAREIREEINIEVSGIEYVKSQPWPFPNSLMTGFKARYLSGEIRPDGIEIEDAQWFTKDNLPLLPAEGSLSRLLINRWLAE